MPPLTLRRLTHPSSSPGLLGAGKGSNDTHAGTTGLMQAALGWLSQRAATTSDP